MDNLYDGKKSSDYEEIFRLAERAAKGDFLALEALLTNSLVHQRMLGLIRKMSRTYFGNNVGIYDAEDLAQDVRLRVIARIHQYNGEERFFIWLHSIARNICIDMLRKSSMAPHGVDIDELSNRPDRTELRRANMNEDLMTLDMVLRELPEHERRVLQLKAEGYTFEEIAAKVGSSRSAVERVFKKARAKILAAFEEFD